MNTEPIPGTAEPPRSIEAEKSLLSVILLDREALYKIASIIRPEDFYLQEHRRIFEAMLAISSENRPVELVTLIDSLEKMGSLEKVGGAAYISSLMDGIPDIGSVVTYAEIIKERSTLRNLITSSGEIIRQCLSGRNDARTVLDMAEKSIFDIAEGSLRGGFVPIKTIVGDNLVKLEDMEKGGSLSGLPTDFAKLDALTNGFHAGDLIIVAGRPGMGKTSFCLNISQNMAVNHNLTVGFFSLEMSKEQLGFRLMCSDAEVDLQAVRSGYLSKSDFRNLGAATDRLSRANIFIDDSAGLDIIEMRSKARRLKKEQGLDCIMVDYLQLMHSHARFENRNLELADISRNLKGLAKELDVPVVALSQLSRQPERRGKDSRPKPSDLRESGALEQDADLVIFLYREEVYDKDTDKKGLAEIIIGKQRNGPTGTVVMVFLNKFTKFASYSGSADEEEAY